MRTLRYTTSTVVELDTTAYTWSLDDPEIREAIASVIDPVLYMIQSHPYHLEPFKNVAGEWCFSTRAHPDTIEDIVENIEHLLDRKIKQKFKATA